jgi:hypothetical protein
MESLYSFFYFIDIKAYSGGFPCCTILKKTDGNVHNNYITREIQFNTVVLSIVTMVLVI